MNTLFAKLCRRNIFRVAGIYALVGWLLIVSMMTPALALPGQVDSFFAILLLVGAMIVWQGTRPVPILRPAQDEV